MLRTGPSTGSLASNLPASGDALAMSGRHHKRCREALSRLPTLDLSELRELWCQLYKTATAPRLLRKQAAFFWVTPVAAVCQQIASSTPDK
jgi:hypothetical protein